MGKFMKEKNELINFKKTYKDLGVIYLMAFLFVVLCFLIIWFFDLFSDVSEIQASILSIVIGLTAIIVGVFYNIIRKNVRSNSRR